MHRLPDVHEVDPGRLNASSTAHAFARRNSYIEPLGCNSRIRISHTVIYGGRLSMLSWMSSASVASSVVTGRGPGRVQSQIISAIVGRSHFPDLVSWGSATTAASLATGLTRRRYSLYDSLCSLNLRFSRTLKLHGTLILHCRCKTFRTAPLARRLAGRHVMRLSRKCLLPGQLHATWLRGHDSTVLPAFTWSVALHWVNGGS